MKSSCFDTKIIASFVEPRALFLVTGKQRNSKNYYGEVLEHNKKFLNEFCEDPCIDFDVYTYLQERINSMRDDDVVLLVTGSRNLMLDISKICYAYCCKMIDNAYCLDKFTDVRRIVDRTDLQYNILQQACRFVLIGNIKKIIDFAKANNLNQFEKLKEYVEK